MLEEENCNKAWIEAKRCRQAESFIVKEQPSRCTAGLMRLVRWKNKGNVTLHVFPGKVRTDAFEPDRTDQSLYDGRPDSHTSLLHSQNSIERN